MYIPDEAIRFIFIMFVIVPAILNAIVWCLTKAEARRNAHR